MYHVDLLRSSGCDFAFETDDCQSDGPDNRSIHAVVFPCGNVYIATNKSKACLVLIVLIKHNLLTILRAICVVCKSLSIYCLRLV